MKKKRTFEKTGIRSSNHVKIKIILIHDIYNTEDKDIVKRRTKKITRE